MAKEFHSLKDWYAGAYLITSSATPLVWAGGTFYKTKVLFTVAIVIFETVSALCGGAPNSKAVIVGREIAGTGSAGIFSGTTVMMTQIIPL